MPKNEKKFYKILDVAVYFDVSPGTVRNWIQNRLLPFDELPGRGTKRKIRRIRVEDLNEFEQKYYRCSEKQKNLIKHDDKEMILLPRK